MSSVARADDTRMLNETFLEYLQTPGMEKKALSAVDDFVRLKVREDGYLRKWLPPITIGNEDLDRRVESDKPYKILDIEADSPAAIGVPFGTLPLNVYIRAKKVPVTFQRFMTPRFTKDVSELRTYHMDIRQILSDNSIKDILTAEDSAFTTAFNAGLVAADTVVPETGVIQWETIPGGVTRDSMLDALKIMPRTPSRLEAATLLVNNITIYEMMKWGRDEFGGDVSEQIAKDGWTMLKIFGRDLMVTIKQDLIPDDSMFMGADPKFLGRFYSLEEVTLYVKREAFMLEFFAYEEIGCTIANLAAIARADFA